MNKYIVEMGFKGMAFKKKFRFWLATTLAILLKRSVEMKVNSVFFDEVLDQQRKAYLKEFNKWFYGNGYENIEDAIERILGK